jgi:hypothetical protein
MLERVKHASLLQIKSQKALLDWFLMWLLLMRQGEKLCSDLRLIFILCKICLTCRQRLKNFFSLSLSLILCINKLECSYLIFKAWWQGESLHMGKISGLDYKPMTIVNDDSRVVNKLEASLTEDARVVIYDRHMFIVQATGFARQI